MASDTRPPPVPPGDRGRRRPGTTIDLEATEIASEPLAPQQTAAQPSSEEPAPEPAEFAAASTAPGEQPMPETETGGRPEAQAPQPEGPANTGATPPGRISIAWLPPDLPWPMVGAGVVGAALAVVLVLIAGMVAGRDSGTGALDARLARVEQQLRELAGRPGPATVDPKAVEDLATRFARLEAAVAAPRPPATDSALVNRVATLEGEVKAVGERIGLVARRIEEFAIIAGDARQRADATTAALAEVTQKVNRSVVERGEVEALANRVATLERTAKAIEAELAKRVTGPAGDRSVRLAVTAAAVNAAVERGDPFAAELAALKSLAPDPRALAPLEPFATSGVPSAAALGRELSRLMPALAQAAGTAPRDASFLERLQANAEKLVRVRPLEEVPGDDPAAILARIELRAAQSDLPGALAELAKLPAQARAPAQAWIAKAEARTEAVELSRRVAADALAALGKSP